MSFLDLILIEGLVLRAMGESRVVCCPEIGRLKLTGCDIEKSVGGLSIVVLCKIGCHAAGSGLGAGEYDLVYAGEVFVVREGRGLDKDVGVLVMLLLGFFLDDWEAARCVVKEEMCGCEGSDAVE